VTDGPARRVGRAARWLAVLLLVPAPAGWARAGEPLVAAPGAPGELSPPWAPPGEAPPEAPPPSGPSEEERLAALEARRLDEAERSLALAEAGLGALAEQEAASRERALAWVRRLRELEEGAADRAAADAAYDRLVADLTTQRAALGGALDRLGTGSEAIPDVPPLEPALRGGPLEARREALVATVDRLRTREASLAWDRVASGRDAMVSMNESRLRLLRLVSGAKRAELRGLGTAGIQQGGREVTQIVLELRYHRHWLPRVATERAARARASPLPEVLGAAKLLGLLLLFWWWRSRADRLLRDLQSHFRARRPPGRLDRLGWSATWYLRRTRAPLEWLGLVAALSTFATVQQVGELGYPLLVLAWAAGGWFLTRLLDAVAARQGEASEGIAELRWRSLRLVGMSVVGVGLLLAVAERSVGRGTLYGWIGWGAWLAVLPVAALLTAWWRPVVFARLRVREHRGRLLEAVLARAEGPAAWPAAAVGGLVLLAEGLRDFLARQVRELESVRRLFAWLLRREIERQAAAGGRVEDLAPLPAELADRLDPAVAAPELIEAHAADELERVRAAAVEAPGTVIAAVGERGLGKTTLLDRLQRAPGLEGALRVDCPPGGFEPLVAELARACGLEGDLSIVRLAQALRERRPPAVLVDDAQRIVRPVIGGLADVDRLLALARTTGRATSWVVAVGTPGFGYLERARGGSVLFDQVVRLPAWTPDEIAALLRARSRQAGIEASFEGLVLNRLGEPGSEEGRHERTERDFHGLIWDYAVGNPVVALHAWRASLRRRPGPGGGVLVRLADLPTADDLDGLPEALVFVLRAVLQLELASESDVVRCTDLRPTEVADALRAARVRGLVEAVGDRLRIALPWYRAVTQALRRRHLVAF
jgi:hypothetical protein